MYSTVYVVVIDELYAFCTKNRVRSHISILNYDMYIYICLFRATLHTRDNTRSVITINNNGISEKKMKNSYYFCAHTFPEKGWHFLLSQQPLWSRILRGHRMIYGHGIVLMFTKSNFKPFRARVLSCRRRWAIMLAQQRLANKTVFTFARNVCKLPIA